MANTPLMLCLENTKSLGLVKQCRRLTCYSTFDDQIEAIYQVQQDLKHHQDPYFHDLTVEYHSYEFDEKHEELILLSYEALIDNLNLDD
jgi:hypothetical protein